MKYPLSCPPDVIVVVEEYPRNDGTTSWKWWYAPGYPADGLGYELQNFCLVSEQAAKESAMQRIPKEYPVGTEFNFTFQVHPYKGELYGS